MTNQGFEPGGEASGEGVEPSPEAPAGPTDNVVGDAAAQPTEATPQCDAPEPATDWQALATERTADLQRLQAEYVNYKRRVDRDRSLARQLGVEAVIADLMPVLDSISLAKSHDDVSGGFKLMVDELERVVARHGLVRFGEVGDLFDPTRHDALMTVPMEGVTATTVSQVMQQGYLLGDRVIRPARVGVANPE